MKNQCREIRSLLDQFLDGDLPGKETSEVKIHLKECPSCRSELQKERGVIKMFEVLPELECPDKVLQNIETAIRDQERYESPIRKLRMVFESFRWQMVSVGVAAAAVLFLIVVSPFTEHKESIPVQYSLEQALEAQTAAKWSLAYAVKTMSTAEEDAVEEVFMEYLPTTMRRSIQNTKLLSSGGV
jgi:predicted anti-sigma-YlaC factor YlaD